MDEKVLGILAKEEWIMTNYEAVKAMGMNELAEFLASFTTCITTCGECPLFGNCEGHHVVCTAGLLEWLNADECSDF